MTNEALKLALEALENAIAVRHGEGGTKFVDPLELNAITAIKDALAQPAQGATLEEQRPIHITWDERGVRTVNGVPDDAQPVQEPVAIYRAGQAKGEVFHVEFLKEMGADEVLLYTTPPQRPWVELTNTEKEKIYRSKMWGTSIYGFADALLAAAKEKNT